MSVMVVDDESAAGDSVVSFTEGEEGSFSSEMTGGLSKGASH